jgi:O-6-methylguanine DNA methyltransferase
VVIIDMAECPSPIGSITLAVHDGTLCALGFADKLTKKQAHLQRRFGAVELRHGNGAAAIVDRLRAYFAGELDALDAIAVDTGGTPFQQRVWSALRTVRPGHTVAYSDLARTIGAPAAVRAVGAANGANPIGIVIPCHRVIGANGNLVGYGGGIERKQWLLRHERSIL